MTTVEDTQEFTVVLSKDAVEVVRSKVASGQYGSESAFIEAAVFDALSPRSPNPELDHWIQTECVRRLEYLKAHPESGITPEQMDAFLDQDDMEFGAAPEVC